MINQKITLKPEPKQFDAYGFLFDKITSFVGFGGGSGGGKTWLGAEWIMQMCYRYPGSKWFIGRNQLKRLMQSSYSTFLKVNEYHKIPVGDFKLNGQYNYIENKNGSRVDLLDLSYMPSDPMYQRLGSLEYTGGWIEEAGEIDVLAFDVLKTRVGRWKNKEFGLFPAKMLLTFNPELNFLFRVFYKPWKSGTLPEDYAFVQALFGDNSYTRDEYGKQLDKIIDPVLRTRLKLGMWEYADSDANLINYDSIVDLFTNTLVPSAQRYITADIARYGSDQIVYGLWQGLNLVEVIEKRKQGIDVTINDLRDLAAKNQIPYSHIVIDDDGVGGGVVDGLRGVKAFVGNSTPLKRTDNKDNAKENYRNLRSQCSFIAAEKINNHEMAISAVVGEKVKDLITEDLQQIKRKDPEREGPLQIIPKEEIKDALGRSPDHGDMIIMRMYFELERPVRIFNQNAPIGGVLPYMPGIDGPIQPSAPFNSSPVGGIQIDWSSSGNEAPKEDFSGPK